MTLWSLNWKDWHLWRDILLYGRAEYHLYYLPVVIKCLLLIPVLQWLWKRPVASWMCIGAIGLLWTIYAYGNAMLPEPHTLRPTLAVISAIQESAGSSLLVVFALLGMMCAGQVRWRLWIASKSNGFWVALFCLGVTLHVLESMVLLEHDYFMALRALKVGRIVSALALFVLFLRQPLMRDPWPQLSRYAFGMHFMHPFVILMLSVAEGYLLGIEISQWQNFALPLLLINLILTFAITYGLCCVIGRFKRLEFLVV